MMKFGYNVCKGFNGLIFSKLATLFVFELGSCIGGYECGCDGGGGGGGRGKGRRRDGAGDVEKGMSEV